MQHRINSANLTSRKYCDCGMQNSVCTYLFFILMTNIFFFSLNVRGILAAIDVFSDDVFVGVSCMPMLVFCLLQFEIECLL